MTTVEEIRTRLDVVKALARDLRPLSYPARLDLHKARRWQAALPRVPADDFALAHAAAKVGDTMHLSLLLEGLAREADSGAQLR